MKYIPVEEFIEEGYLQEVNRQFFHPLGLALVVGAEKDENGEVIGPWEIKGIWDARDDPEGVIFDPETLDPEKAIRVSEFEEDRMMVREEALGYWVQPITSGLGPSRQGEPNPPPDSE